MGQKTDDGIRLDGTTEPDVSEHLVQFYDGDGYLLDTVSRFAGTALAARDAAVVIATREHRALLAERLAARGFDVGSVREQGRYICLDAIDLLSRFMVDGWPDEGRFMEVVGGVIEAAGEAPEGGRHVRAFGEMVAVLAARGNREAAIRLEELWSALAGKLAFSLLCAYPLSVFPGEQDGKAFLEVCARHSRVIPAESYSALTDSGDRLRAITHLQQKAGALQAEAVERKKVEKSLHLRERELSDFLENAVEGIQRVGPDGRILWANRALLDLLGYTPAEYVGCPLVEFHADPARALAAGFDYHLAKPVNPDMIQDLVARLGRSVAADPSILH